jgi:hypothetical protein
MPKRKYVVESDESDESDEDEKGRAHGDIRSTENNGGTRSTGRNNGGIDDSEDDFDEDMTLKELLRKANGVSSNGPQVNTAEATDHKLYALADDYEDEEEAKFSDAEDDPSGEMYLGHVSWDDPSVKQSEQGFNTPRVLEASMENKAVGLRFGRDTTWMSEARKKEVEYKKKYWIKLCELILQGKRRGRSRKTMGEWEAIMQHEHGLSKPTGPPNISVISTTKRSDQSCNNNLVPLMQDLTGVEAHFDAEMKHGKGGKWLTGFEHASRRSPAYRLPLHKKGKIGCHCYQKELRMLYGVTHRKSGVVFFVGSECVQHFNSDVRKYTPYDCLIDFPAHLIREPRRLYALIREA